jgi:hypothetical protein
MKIKKSFDIANQLFIIGFVLWIIETIVFLFIHGWHVEAIGIEQSFDTAVTLIVWIGFVFWMFSVNKIIRLILDNNDI